MFGENFCEPGMSIRLREGRGVTPSLTVPPLNVRLLVRPGSKPRRSVFYLEGAPSALCGRGEQALAVEHDSGTAPYNSQ
jgi:hypothetical protein